MREIYVYGMKTRDKTMLILYLAKLLACEEKVAVVMERTFLQEDNMQYYYNDNLLIKEDFSLEDEDKVIEVEWVIRDIYDYHEEQMTTKKDACKLFVMGSWKDEVLYNEHFLSALKEGDVVVYNGLLYDSGIDVKYLNRRFKIDDKAYKIIQMYVNERDLATHLDNEYNMTLNMKMLSRQYKKNLAYLLSYITLDEIKKCNKRLKKSVRRT